MTAPMMNIESPDAATMREAGETLIRIVQARGSNAVKIAAIKQLGSLMKTVVTNCTFTNHAAASDGP